MLRTEREVESIVGLLLSRVLTDRRFGLRTGPNDRAAAARWSSGGAKRYLRQTNFRGSAQKMSPAAAHRQLV